VLGPYKACNEFSTVDLRCRVGCVLHLTPNVKRSARLAQPCRQTQPHTSHLSASDLVRFSSRACRAAGWGVGASPEPMISDPWRFGKICLTARAHSTRSTPHNDPTHVPCSQRSPPASASHLHAPGTANALLRRVPPRAPPRAAALRLDAGLPPPTAAANRRASSLLLRVRRHVELEKDDVLVLHDIIFALLPVLARLLHSRLGAAIFLPVLEVVNFGLDKSALKV